MFPASPSPPFLCPGCNTPDGRWLKDTSRDMDVDYFRCDACGHVWWVQKTGIDRSTHDVTDRVTKKPE
jgi:hypothetical protein